MRHFIDGKETSEEQFKQSAPHAQAAYYIGENGPPNIKAVFSTENDHEEWLTRYNLLDRVRKQEAARQAALNIKPRDETKLAETQGQILASAQQYLDYLMEGQPEETKDQVLTEILESHNYLLGGSSFVVLYKHCGFTGSWKFLITGAWPSFRWLGFNDQTSSLKCIGLGITLWEHDWFKGGQKTFIGLPYIFVDCLVADGFNDKASSAVVFVP